MSIRCSVVIPLCNEEENLPVLHSRLTAALQSMEGDYEIVYIDDGSTDHTPELMQALHSQDEHVRGVFLSRNFGHQAALCAGLAEASGQAIISMDGDLQDPPELIPELMKKWEEGYQIVFARRRKRQEHVLKRLAYFTFYRLLRCVSEIEIPLDTGDFALMSRQALDELNAMPERTRFIRGLRSWLGFKQGEVIYDRDPRLRGVTKYSLKQLFKLAMDGFIVFSELPLKVITWTGLAVSATAAVALIAALCSLSAWPSAGIAALTAGIVLLGGVQLVGMGVLGEYVGRIYREVRSRPMYIIHSRIGFATDAIGSPKMIDIRRARRDKRSGVVLA